jgi:hypothetical protein
MCTMRRVSIALAAAALMAACAAPAAMADGDPASDVLITDSLYLPYEAPPADVVGKLRGVVTAAKAAGQTVRVAVIHSPQDLGAVSNLYGHPQEYANLLATELQNPVEPGARGHREELLVVMPAGFGTKNVPDKVSRMLRGVELPADADPAALAQAAGWAGQELAAASGRPIREEFDKPEGDSGGGALTIVLVVLALVALAGVLIVLRVRAGGSAGAAEGQSPGGNK